MKLCKLLMFILLANLFLGVGGFVDTEKKATLKFKSLVLVGSYREIQDPLGCFNVVVKCRARDKHGKETGIYFYALMEADDENSKCMLKGLKKRLKEHKSIVVYVNYVGTYKTIVDRVIPIYLIKDKDNNY